jgi:nitroreductase
LRIPGADCDKQEVDEKRAQQEVNAMAEILDLSPDELLSTTRTVRKRLDLERQVERPVLEACLKLAQQAPAASNRQHWHFLVVTDSERRAALGELYRKGAELAYSGRFAGIASADPQTQKLLESAKYLVDHMHEVPVQVVPCIEGRPDDPSPKGQAGMWGTICPAIWSFMLACRSRGLGTAWTTFHLAFEREAADILGIPFDEVSQAALIPVAYTIGTDFKPARRAPLETMVHWETW